MWPLSLLASLALVAAAPSQRNVVFLSSDSMDGRLLDPRTRYETLVAMPALRKLASSGANFVRAYSHSPVCGPSRASLMTSRFIHEIGVWNNYQELVPAPGATGVDDACVSLYGLQQCLSWAGQYPINYTMFDAFASAGYDMSGIFGKIDIGANSPERLVLETFAGALARPIELKLYASPPRVFFRWPTSDQSDDHTGPELRNVPRGANIPLNSMGAVQSNTNGGPNTQASDEEVIAKAVAWLQAKAVGTTPFFLYAGISIPHFPFVTNSSWLAKVNQSAITLPPWKNMGDMHPYDLHVSRVNMVLALRVTARHCFGSPDIDRSCR
jgi:arylsulfatase A-like enzyme